MTSLAVALEARMRTIGTPHRAEGQKRYLKSDLRFLGATVTQVREAVREMAPRMDHDELIAAATELWLPPIHELRTASVILLVRSARQLRTDDLAFIERLVRESRTWALVDYLAIDVLGAMVEAEPSALRKELDRWSIDRDFWIRRASLLAELRPIRHGASMDPFFARAQAMLEERQFFIRKAIGWVLREAGKGRPAEVAAWLRPRAHRASGVTLREATKYLPTDVGEELMRAYRESRPLT
jgi:3-methyladenine DNA glycosylase AlkD